MVWAGYAARWWVVCFFFGDEVGGNASIASVATPYVIVGVFVLLAALVFRMCKLPEPKEEEKVTPSQLPIEGELQGKKNMEGRHERIGVSGRFSHIFWFGVVALFLYVSAQTGVNSNFVAYFIENVGISKGEASLWLSFGGMGLFFVGRLVGSWLMGYIRADRLLLAYAAGATLGTLIIILCTGWLSMGAFFLVYLCESIMFPTIFSLALRGAEGETKRASSYLIMTIVGGAVAPLLMGCIADMSCVAVGFVVPLVCYVVIGADLLQRAGS